MTSSAQCKACGHGADRLAVWPGRNFTTHARRLFPDRRLAGKCFVTGKTVAAASRCRRCAAQPVRVKIHATATEIKSRRRKLNSGEPIMSGGHIPGFTRPDAKARLRVTLKWPVKAFPEQIHDSRGERAISFQFWQFCHRKNPGSDWRNAGGFSSNAPPKSPLPSPWCFPNIPGLCRASASSIHLI